MLLSRKEYYCNGLKNYISLLHILYCILLTLKYLFASTNQTVLLNVQTKLNKTKQQNKTKKKTNISFIGIVPILLSFGFNDMIFRAGW